MDSTTTTTKDIRIKNVSPTQKKQLRNIAKHVGVSLTAFLKMELGKLIKSYPEHIVNPSEQPQ